VKRNAAFGAGICCQHLKENAISAYPQILQALGPLFSLDTSSNDAAACVDNAVAAVARMIMTAPSHIPLSQVLPVMLKALPLKTDMTENETVYDCLLGLLEAKNPDILSNRTELQRVFTEAASEESKVGDDIKEKLIAVLQS
jgi:importin-4